MARWSLIYKDEERIEAKPRGGSCGKVDKILLSKFVKNNPDKTLVEIGKHFGISSVSVYKRLKNLVLQLQVISFNMVLMEIRWVDMDLPC